MEQPALLARPVWIDRLQYLIAATADRLNAPMIKTVPRTQIGNRASGEPAVDGEGMPLDRILLSGLSRSSGGIRAQNADALSQTGT
jgi:hypothetical protein